MPAMGPAKVKSRKTRSGRTSANALTWRARSARRNRRLSGTSVDASAPVKSVIGVTFGRALRSALLRCPFVEALGQAVDVLEPEGNVDLDRVLDVVRRCRQVLQNGRCEQRGCVLVRGAISNVLRQLRLILHFADEIEELVGRVLVRATFQDHPGVEGEERAVPHHAEILL